MPLLYTCKTKCILALLSLSLILSFYHLIVKAFVIFCGLGINNTMMYNQVKKTWAKQSVALDVSLLPSRKNSTKTRHPTAFDMFTAFISASVWLYWPVPNPQSHYLKQTALCLAPINISAIVNNSF